MIKALRFLFLPFPVATLLSASALTITDHLLRPDRSGIDDSLDAGYVIGSIAFFMAVASFQIFLGVPSLLILDARRSKQRGYLVTAIAIAVVLSFSFSKVFMAPEFGETMGWMYPRVFAYLGGPVVLSYWLAFRLRPTRDG